jgi:hypothetical protein
MASNSHSGYHMINNPLTDADEAHMFEPHYEVYMWLYRDTRTGCSRNSTRTRPACIISRPGRSTRPGTEQGEEACAGGPPG